MIARSRDESHRASTPLECLLDLCFVVAVAQAAGQLHHGISAGEHLHAVLSYVQVFFAIWWAWMNFTWFASAYDNDDVPYRLLVLVEIAGSLVLAAGIPRAFEGHGYEVVTLGYAIMRVGLLGHWLRAAHDDPAGRRTALRYALGIALCQIGWISLLFAPPGVWMLAWPVLVLSEMMVPLWAERHVSTSWHPVHIAERYGLFTLIVLGESISAATVAIQGALGHEAFSPHLAALIGSALLIVFAMWWLYFNKPVHDLLKSNKVGFWWGYGHLVIFASTAAVGAGVSVLASQTHEHGTLTHEVAACAVAIPVAIYVASVWMIHIRPVTKHRAVTPAFLLTAALVLLTPLAPWPLALIAALMVALVGVLVATNTAENEAVDQTVSTEG